MLSDVVHVVRADLPNFRESYWRCAVVLKVIAEKPRVHVRFKIARSMLHLLLGKAPNATTPVLSRSDRCSADLENFRSSQARCETVDVGTSPNEKRCSETDRTTQRPRPRYFFGVLLFPCFSQRTRRARRQPRKIFLRLSQPRRR